MKRATSQAAAAQPRASFQWDAMLRWMAQRSTGAYTVRELVEDAILQAEREGLHSLDESPELSEVRPFELAAALNRMRSLKIRD